MSDLSAARRAVIGRGLGLLAIAFALAACEPAPEATQHVTYLPASTPRLHARTEREKQLVTATYRDDFPEFTGAPNPKTASWPAPVPAVGKTVYRGDYVTTTPSSR